MGISVLLGTGKTSAQESPPIKSLIDSVSTKGVRTDIDSLMKLPRRELSQYLENSEKNPTRIEFDTVKIKPINLKKDFDYTSTLINSFYVERFNIIRIHYFVPDEAVHEKDTATLGLIDAMNHEIPFALVHEETHAVDAQNILTDLDFDEHVRYVIESEIAPRIKEKLKRRSVFINTKSIKAAFPRAYFFMDYEMPDSNLESREYIQFLIKNADKLDPNQIKSDEADVILNTVLRNANVEFLHYHNDGQFLQQIKANLSKARRQIAQNMPGQSFKELSDKRYQIMLDNKPLNFFDLLSPGRKEIFDDIIKVFCQQPPEFNLALSEIKNKFIPFNQKGYTR